MRRVSSDEPTPPPITVRLVCSRAQRAWGPAFAAFEESKIANRIVVARDGLEALEYLFATGAHAGRDERLMPEVVLLDLNLPKIDGLEVLRRLRADARTQHLPVVVLTSSNEEQDVLRSYGLGANSFVRKPVDFTRFLEAAQQRGLYWLVLNEPPPNSASPHGGGNPSTGTGATHSTR